MNEQPSSKGGKREGAGRPSQGKTRVNLTLSEDLVEKARAKESNLSALLDRLLAQWLKA
jgi:post-segregation antitoxin (ccd killing protein)